ncbi:MAG: glycosyltransferase [Bacteroidales bacterium]|nr:glycosyltransferase [Bacteroidales bacterium]
MKQNKKVLIITYYWPPSGGAGVQRWLKFAKYLPEFGIEPIILTVDSENASYPQIDTSLENDISSDLKVFKTKSFEPLNLLSGLFGKKSVPYGGFTNVNKKSFLQTILRFVRGNFFIPDARIGWNKFAYKKAKEIISEYNIDTVITTSPPHSTQLIGLKLKKNLNVNWIADFRDPWTDIYYYKDLLHTNFVKGIDKKKERQVLEKADKIITNCESNKTLLENKLSDTNNNKFHVITNGFDEDDFITEIKNPKEFIITYSGTISENYKPETFLIVLSDVKKKFPDIEFKLRMVGNVSQDIKALIEKHNLIEIYEAVGYVQHSKLIEYLVSSTILFYIFPKTDNDKGIAGKLFEYLAARKTIIGIGPKDGDSAKIMEECEAGKMFEREEEINLKEYFEMLVKSWEVKRNLNLNSKDYLKYSRKNLTQSLEEFI